MKVTILGNNSALPAFGRHPSCQIVSVYGEDLMLDCGEGTQMQMHRYGLRWRNLGYIFISHLHGDHYFGLPGLINSMNLLSRTAPLHVFGPPALEGILQQILDVADTVLCFPYEFHPLPEGSALLVDTPSFSVTCFPVEHRISCHGFVVERKTRGRKILPDRCGDYGVPSTFFDRLKQGEDYVTPEGMVVKNEWVTEAGPSPRRYAYCADTLFTESFLPYVTGVDTLYHECTYLDADAEKAAARFHTTARQAAQLARMANAKQLLLGHFSSKYRDLEPFRAEAAEVFPGAQLAVEGVAYEI
jgi:ribonuclease Z